MGKEKKFPGVPSEKMSQTPEMLALKTWNVVAFLNLRCTYLIIGESDTSTHQIPRFFLIYLDPNRSKIHAFLAKLHVEKAGKRQPLLEAPPRPLVLVHAMNVLGHNLTFIPS